MRETKAYKTYLGCAIGATPTKIPRKFKKAFPSKKDINLNLVPVGEEPKSAKKKMKEVHKKSMRDFYRTHPSGSGKVSKIPPSAEKIKPSVTNEGNGAKPDVAEEESTKSEAESWGRDEDDSNNDHDSSSDGSDQENDSGDDNTQSDNEKGSDSEQETDENESGSESDQQENEEEVDDNAKGDEDKGMDDTTNLLYDDVDVRLNDSVHADEEFVQKEGTNAKMINIQQENENLEITLDQVIEDAHVTISTVAKNIEVRVTSSSPSSDLASKS
ncbi:hypothetical protein Tco_0775855 [Tanacetum coccineum]